MQLNCPVAGSSDSMLSTNPGCAWMRGRNWLFSAFLKSFSLAGFMVQVMRRESMFSSFCGKIGNEGFGSHASSLRSEEHTSELQSHHDLVCRLLLEKKKINMYYNDINAV